MKKYISQIILASFTMVLAGCSSHSPAASTRPAIDFVQAGKDIEFAGGYVLHITKREGSSLEGIHILATLPDGQVREITAETGTIKPGTPEHSNFENQVTITLHNAKTVTGPTNSTAFSEVIVLYKQSADDKSAVLPARHLSEQQVAEIASRELPSIQNFSCQFTNGVWEIQEVQTDAWVSSTTTNADGHIFVQSTHPKRLVLQVVDADGKVEHVKTD